MDLEVTCEKGDIPENYLNDLFEFLDLFKTNDNQEFSMIISIYNDYEDSFKIFKQRVHCIYNVFIDNNLDNEIKNLVNFMNEEDFDE